MRFTLFSIDSDDLSVTIFMEENYQKMGAKYGSGSNLEAKQSEDKTLKYENQQKKFRELQATDNNSSSSGHGLHSLA